MAIVSHEEFVKIDKLSDLLEVGLSSLKALDRKKYHADFSAWHKMNYVPGALHPEYKCVVCLSGAVIASNSRDRFRENLAPLDFPAPVARRLYALDFMRSGQFLEAYAILNDENWHSPGPVNIQSVNLDDSLRLSAIHMSIPDDVMSFRNWQQADQFIEVYEDMVVVLRERGF